MRWVHAVAFVSLCALLALTACQYQGKVDPGFYTPQQSFTEAEGRIAAKVGFVDDGRLEKLEVWDPNESYGLKLNIGAALKDAILKQLQAAFSDVVVLPRVAGNEPVDLYAVPAVGLIKVPGKASPVEFAYRLGLQIAFVARDIRQQVDVISGVVPMNFHPPTEAQAFALSGALTMGALMPITERLKNDILGEEYQRVAREAIEQVVHKVGEDLASRSFRDSVEIFVSLGPIDEPSSGSSRPAASPPSQYDKYLDAVVTVVAGDKRMGAGFFVSPDGWILTCNHVVAGEETVTVKDRAGRVLAANVMKTSRERDLALLRVSSPSSIGTFRSLSLAGEELPPIGRDVITIGAAEGFPWSVSRGIVSGIRQLRTARAIQTDAVMSPGSSGGPLIDVVSGRVVGVASISVGRPGESVNFAIAADEARKAFGAEIPHL